MRIPRGLVTKAAVWPLLVVLVTATLGEPAFEKELRNQRYHQQRNDQAEQSHTKTRIPFYLEHGIDVDQIRSSIV